jgi:uncharacterized protein (TIGR00251 family)
MISLKESPSGVSFAVRVQPRASRTAISGVLGVGDNAALKISLTAPPVEGQANEALVRFFAELLNIPRSSVEIISGSQSRSKVVRIREVSAERILSRLKQPAG